MLCGMHIKGIREREDWLRGFQSPSYPGWSGRTPRPQWSCCFTRVTPLIIRTHLQPGTWGQRGSRGGMKPEPTAAETECQHQVRKSPFLLRGSLPKGMSGEHANCRKPTQVLIPVLRARAESGFVKLMPEQWETRRARHMVKNTRETG